MLAVAMLLACLACVWLALSQQRNRKALGLSADEGASRVLRRGGQGMLALSFAVCLASDGPSFAVLLWFLLVAAFSLSTALLLAYAPFAASRLIPGDLRNERPQRDPGVPP
jgi:ABC-type xylose transport system permease subunit